MSRLKGQRFRAPRSDPVAISRATEDQPVVYRHAREVPNRGLLPTNALKIRSRESEVWVRIPSSAPMKKLFSKGDWLGFASLSASHSRAGKRMKRHVICQVFVKCREPCS